MCFHIGIFKAATCAMPEAWLMTDTKEKYMPIVGVLEMQIAN